MENEQNNNCDMIKAFMPVTKTAEGKYVGILSDSSMDRDKEFMSKDLLVKWSKNSSIKALANHVNKMENWVGGWRNLKVIDKAEHSALVAEPWFFSKEANPLAAQIEKQVEEALANGENPGISIGAIPGKSSKKEINGEFFKVYEDAELVEATWVPIQSNRNATFGHIAKSFDIELTKPKAVEDCVKALMADADFHPKDGRTKEESAWAVCQAKFGGKSFEEPQMIKDSEPKMTEELVMVEKTPEIEKPVEQVEKEAAAEITELVKQSSEDAAKLTAKIAVLEEQNKKLELELKEFKEKAILKGTVEGPIIKEQIVVDEPLTIEKMLKLRFGGK
ncbi:MAG: hypothetical protein ACOYWZ_13375 [Bacillota bacterium]